MTAPGLPALLGVCHDASSSFMRGPAAAPGAIRQALASDASNTWSEDLRSIERDVIWRDAGDIAPGPDPVHDITASVAALIGAGSRPVVLGGDHSVSWPVLRALRPRHRPLSIVHLDAHNDLYDHYEGDRTSHACPFARIMEEGLADELIQVGIRTMTGHQREQADRFGVQVIDMRGWVAGERPRPRYPVYLSLDVDVLDPAHAPGVSHREPGGMTVREVLGVVQAIEQPWVGADLVEYNPLRDVDGMTAIVCAKLLKEILAAMTR